MRVFLLCLLGLHLAEAQSGRGLKILTNDGAITLGAKGDVVVRRGADGSLMVPKKFRVGGVSIEQLIENTVRARIKPQIDSCKRGYKGPFCDVQCKVGSAGCSDGSKCKCSGGGGGPTKPPTKPPVVCRCTKHLQWVCGTNGKSYSNPCTAKCAKATVLHQGRCGTVPKGSKMLGGNGVLKKGNALKAINLPLDYEIGFDIKVTGKVSGWSSIVHFTTGGNCCGYGSRIPGVWFWPNTMKLYVVDGHAKNGNFGTHDAKFKCNNALLTLKTNVNYRVQLILQQRKVHVAVNGKIACSNIPRVDRKVFKNVKVYLSDPWYPAAKATVTNLWFRQLPPSVKTTPKPKPPPVPKGSRLLGGNGVLKKNRALPAINLPLDYEIGFTIRPQAGKVTGWSNILHFTTGGNCCGYGSRIPGIWFWPNTQKLYIVDGHAKNGNFGTHDAKFKCNNAVLTLKGNMNYRVVLRLMKSTVSVYVNGKAGCTNIPRVDRKAFNKVKVYLSDPWYPAAKATVMSLYFRKIAPAPIKMKQYNFNYKGNLRKNARFTTKLSLPLDFEVGITIRPIAKLSGWSNIFHFTTGSNCCGYGSRIPAVWFWPNTLKLYVVDGHHKNGNFGTHDKTWKCNNALLTLLPNRNYALKFLLKKKTVSVYVNNKLACNNIPRLDRRVFKNVHVYMADPWYPAARASVSGFYVKHKA